jgi:integrase
MMKTGHTSQLSQFEEYYQSKNAQRLSWAARQKARYSIRQLVKCLGDVAMESIDLADCEDFQEYLAGVVSRTSANSYIATIGTMFNFALRRDMIAENPFDKLRPLKVTPTEIRVFNSAEVAAILRSANQFWRFRILAALTAGLRKGEVLNLTRDDIDERNQIIRVQPKRKTEVTWQWEPKDYEIRVVPLAPEFYNLLVTFILPSIPADQPYTCLTDQRYGNLRKRIDNLDERVQKTPDENWRPFRNLMLRAGVEGTFHDLRRTCITIWSRSLPAQEVMKLAGHSDFETTLRYYAGIRPDIIALASNATSGAIRGDRN